MHIGLVLLAALAASLLSQTPAGAMSDERYIASVDLVGFPYCPEGTVELWGQPVVKADEASLAYLLGTRFGGDPAGPTLNLPNLQGQAPPGTRWCLTIRGDFPQPP